MIYQLENGIYCREGTVDEQTVGEVRRYRKVFSGDKNFSGTILDAGAHIGSFARLCVEMFPGCNVICYEPDSDNFGILQKNCDSYPNIFLNNRAVSKFSGVKTFYLVPGIKGKQAWGTDGHSLTPIRGRTKVEVETEAFSEIIRKYKPEIVKIDIEGAEYEIIDEIIGLPNFVKGIAIELHNRKPIEKCQKLLDGILKAFPKILRYTNSKTNKWPKEITGRRS